LKASGGMQKLGLLSFGELEKSRIITTWKNVNLGLIIGMKISIILC
jgi:hypothetical protein